MYTEQAIKKAIEGGWRPKDLYGIAVKVESNGKNILVKPFGKSELSRGGQ